VLRGEIPEGVHLHHTCKNRACVNPWHLEPLTAADHVREHAAAKTHCPQGHPYEGDNLRINTAGARVCRECQRQRSYAQYMKRKQAQRRLR